MLPLLLAIIIFMFLLVGAVAFLVCVLLPATRRFALSIAIWFAMWGPCSTALLVLAGVGLVAGGLVLKSGENPLMNAPKLAATLGWTYLIFGAIVTSNIATAIARIHQFLLHRLTFFLFRLYATVLAAGIGSVFGWSLGWWIISHPMIRHGGWWWALGMTALIAVFATTSFKGARALRGKQPTAWTWISQEEFDGSLCV
jgi:hypothetical protein